MDIKKTVALMLSASLAMSCFASCKKKDKNIDGDVSSAVEEITSAADDKKTITIYTVENSESLTSPEKLGEIAGKFEQETGIHVAVQTAESANAIKPRLETQDDTIDIFTMNGWSDDEWVQFAEPYCTLDEARELYGEYADEMYGDDKNVYALSPAKIYDNGVVYNEDTIKAVGYDTIPTTQLEFEQMCSVLRNANVDPLLLRREDKWTLSSINTFANYVSGRNDAYPAMLKNDTPFSAGEPIGKTIRIYAGWKQRGFFETAKYKDHDEAISSIGSGKTAMVLSGTWVVSKIQQSMTGNAASIKFAPAPDFGAGRFVMTSPAGSFSIAKGSKNKTEARQFIEYISNDAQFIADCGCIATKSSVTPIIPEVFTYVENEIALGTCQVLFTYKSDLNYTHNEEVLSKADLLGNVKYAGDLLDCVDVGEDVDWEAFDDKVNEQNEAYAKAKAGLGYSWLENAPQTPQETPAEGEVFVENNAYAEPETYYEYDMYAEPDYYYDPGYYYEPEIYY